MPRRLVLLLALACAALLATPAQAAELLAVLELSGDLPDKQRRALTNAVRQAATDATAPAGIKVMTQENMETLLTDMGLDASCISEGACEVDTLRNLQANYGVTGEVTDFGGTYVVTLQLYEMRGGTMMGAETVDSANPLELMKTGVPGATMQLLGRLPGVSAPAVAVVTPVAPAPAPVTAPAPAPVPATAPAPSGPTAAVAPLPAAAEVDGDLAARIEAARAEGAAIIREGRLEGAAIVREGSAEARAKAAHPAMKKVPAGTYEVGCTKGQSDCGKDEKPKRQVTLSRAYEVMVHEVRQGEYAAVMGTNPSHFSSCGDSCPVEQVSWVDAVTYANAVSREAGLEECYTIRGETVSWPNGLSCTGYRLPTEMEWAVAARGGADRLYSGGDSADSVGWTDSNSGAKTHAVMQKSPNGYGLYDMSGNVWEWTWDWYGKKTYKEREVTDPLGPVSGSFRVYRGGGWSLPPAFARVANRSWRAPSARYNALGFRLARTAP